MKKLPVFTAAAGIAACGLHLAARAWATDHKGLLLPGHPICILLWALTAAIALLVLWKVRTLDGSGRYADNFRPSNSAFLGCLAMALGIFFTILEGRGDLSTLTLVRSVIGALSILGLTWAGISRRDGKTPFFLYYAVVCVYLTMHTIARYQSWSSQSQMLDYFFPMMGCVLLALFSYQQTAFPLAMAKRRMQLATGLLGSFFCFGAAALGADVPLYAAGGIWMLTGLCSLTPVPRRRRPAPSRQEPEQS